MGKGFIITQFLAQSATGHGDVRLLYSEIAIYSLKPAIRKIRTAFLAPARPMSGLSAFLAEKPRLFIYPQCRPCPVCPLLKGNPHFWAKNGDSPTLIFELKTAIKKIFGHAVACPNQTRPVGNPRAWVLPGGIASYGTQCQKISEFFWQKAMSGRWIFGCAVRSETAKSVLSNNG